MFEADKACGVVESSFFLVAPPREGLSVAPRDSDRCWKQFMMFFGGDSVCGDDSFPLHAPVSARCSVALASAQHGRRFHA